MYCHVIPRTFRRMKNLTTEMVVEHERQKNKTSDSASRSANDFVIGNLVPVHPSCFKTFKKRVDRSQKSKSNINAVAPTLTQAPTVTPGTPPPALSTLALESEENGNFKKLSEHSGSFVYVHKPVSLDALSPPSKAANEKCFYTLLQQRSAGGRTLIKARNANPRARPITLRKLKLLFQPKKIKKFPDLVPSAE